MRSTLRDRSLPLGAFGRLLLGVAWIASMLAYAPSASGDWPPEGLTLCQDCDARFPLPAFDGQGGVFVVWVDVQNPTVNDDIYAQRITVGGEIAPGWPARGIPICTNPSDNQPTFRSVAVQDGGVILSWTDYRNAIAGGTSADIYAQRVLADGSLAPGWLENGVPVVRSPRYDYYPSTLPDGVGGAFFPWSDETNSDIFLQRLTADAQVAPGWPVDGLPVCTDPFLQSYPLLAPDGVGGVLMTWFDTRDGVRAAYAQRITANGQTHSGWPENGTRIVVDRNLRELASDGKGGAFLSCATSTHSGGYDSLYFLQRFTGSGSIAPGWSEGGTLICQAPDGRSGIRMVQDGVGGVLLVWDDNRVFGDDEIYMQHVTSGGTLHPGWPIDGLRISDNTVFDSFPDLTPDGQGGAYVCWDRVGGPFGKNRVVVQHMTGEGTIVPGWPADRYVIPGDGIMSHPRVVVDGEGGAIVVWEQDVYTLRALRFGIDGPTAVQVALVYAEADPDAARLTWRLTSGTAIEVTVERRTESGPWQSLGSAALEADATVRFEDRSVTAGTRYAYRLRYRDAGLVAFSAEEWLTIPARIALAVRGFVPNPCFGNPTVAFALPTADPATLEVFDAQGRRALSREVGSLGPGTHRVRVADTALLAAGVYSIRLTHAGRTLTTRGIVIR